MEQNYKIVTESCSDLRTMARQSLDQKWNTAVLATLLEVAVMMVPSFMIVFLFESDFSETITNIYSLLVGAPLSFGFIVLMMKLFRGGDGSPTEIFYGFEKLGKTIGLSIMVYIKTLFWVFPFVFPAALITVSMAGANVFGVFATLIATVLFVVGMVFGVMASLRYAFAFLVLADDPTTPIMTCINESKRMMEGNKMKLFTLQLSFLGWLFLCVVTCGVALLWVEPYMSMSQIAMYEIVKGNVTVAYQAEGAGFVTAEPKGLQDAESMKDPENDLENTQEKNVENGRGKNMEKADENVKVADEPKEYMPEEVEKPKETTLDGKAFHEE